MLDLGTVKILSWIAHDVPRVRRADRDDAALELSEVPAPADPTVGRFFRLRVNGALGADKRDVTEEDSTASPVPAAVREYLVGERDLTSVSRLCARHLYGCQTGATSAGLLVVAEVDAAGVKGLALLKLEPQDGAQATRRVIDGKVTYEVQVLTDLLLTKGTKVFKVALFTEDDVSRGVLSGRAADPQNTTGTAGEPAEFFLRRFLGCRLTETPDVTTKRFLDAAERYANDEIPDAAERAKFTVALHAELRSNHTQVRPGEFAAAALPAGRRRRFVERLAGEGVPAQGFPKARQAVEKYLAKVSFTFQDGTMVVTTSESLDQGKVEVEAADDDRTRLQVLERLTRIGKRAR